MIQLPKDKSLNLYSSLCLEIEFHALQKQSASKKNASTMPRSIASVATEKRHWHPQINLRNSYAMRVGQVPIKSIRKYVWYIV